MTAAAADPAPGSRMAPPPGFSRLGPGGPEPSGHVGCLFLLGGTLALLGGGIFALYFLDPDGQDAWVSLIVGGGFGLVGLLLLYAGICGQRGLKIARTELFLEQGAVLAPGISARLRVHQPGPASFDSFTVRLVCERLYQRRVHRSGGTVEDAERLVEQELLILRNTPVPAGAVAEREVVLTIPAGAPPDGPASPDGRIRWRIEVMGDAGVMRRIFHSFPLTVVVGATGPEEGADGDCRFTRTGDR